MLQYKRINGYTDIDVNADVYSTQQNILHFVQKNACSPSYIKKGKDTGRDMVQLCWNAVTELAAKRQIRARKIAVFVAARKMVDTDQNLSEYGIIGILQEKKMKRSLN